MLRDGGSELLYLPAARLRRRRAWTHLGEMLHHPGTVLGLGDGGAHCGVLCDASLPTFMLTHWARDRDAATRCRSSRWSHHQTRRTATLYGFADRGLLAPGMLADVNVIDWTASACDAPEMAYDLPAGGKRLVQRARLHRHDGLGRIDLRERAS